MSKDLNKVLIIGRLGKDPEVKYTPQGSAFARFTVASGRKWRTNEGEEREDTEWFNVVAWDKLAETCGQYLQKGSRVYIEGRLQTRSWDDQQAGQKRYMTEVIANDMIMLGDRERAPEQTHQDDEHQSQEPEPAAAAPLSYEVATPRQVKALQLLAAERGQDIRKVLIDFNIKQLEDLSLDDAGILLTRWQQMPRVQVRGTTPAPAVPAAPAQPAQQRTVNQTRQPRRATLPPEDDDLPF